MLNELDPDAQAFVTSLSENVFPQPMHRLGVQECRRRLASLPHHSDPPVDSVKERTIPGPSGEIPVRIYRPGSEDAALPVLVWLHGGGWCTGSPDSCDTACRTLANAGACVVVSVDYRLAPEHKFPAPFDDAYAAVAWVAAHAGRLDGDGARLAVGGDSAGATLAAAVALHARERGPELRLQVLIYPCPEYPGADRPSFVRCLGGGPVVWSEDVGWSWDIYLRDERDRLDPRAVPASASSLTGAAPAVVVTAELDPVHDDGQAYAERLAADGVAVTQLPVTGVPHGFFNLPGVIAKATQAHADVAAALRRAWSDEGE